VQKRVLGFIISVGKSASDTIHQKLKLTGPRRSEEAIRQRAQALIHGNAFLHTEKVRFRVYSFIVTNNFATGTIWRFGTSNCRSTVVLQTEGIDCT
jgi:hypothetical protein